VAKKKKKKKKGIAAGLQRRRRTRDTIVRICMLWCPRDEDGAVNGKMSHHRRRRRRRRRWRRRRWRQAVRASAGGVCA